MDPVRDLVGPGAPLGLTLVAGARGLDHQVFLSRVQRPGLALTGYTEYIRYGRVQIVGGSEIGYLRKLAPRRRSAILGQLCRCRISCFVVTKGLAPPAELLSAAEGAGIPVLTTPAESTPVIKQLSSFLDERLALRLHLHSVLMDVFGLGVLIVGESGIGKSECALDLIDRGHRLVADDVVEIKRIGDVLIGRSPDLTRYHMELRGLGVINIKDLYGVSSIRTSQRVELVVSLERWEAGREYDRLGLQAEKFLVLDQEVPLIRMPVAPGRNLAILVEVAARNQLLKERGYDAAQRFVERVDAMIAAGSRAARGGGGLAPVRPPRGAPRPIARRRRRREPGTRRARCRPPRAARPRDHRPLGLGEDARLPRPRGHGLVLRRQPAHGAHPAVRGADPTLPGAGPVGPGGGHPGARLRAPVPRGLPPAQGKGPRGEPALPGGRRSRAAPPFQRDPAPPPPGGEPARHRGHPGGAQEALRPIRKMADLILDTTDYTVHRLRDYIREHYDLRSSAAPLVVAVMSFGYKYGVPSEADLVFDVRFLPNPNFVPRLKRPHRETTMRSCATSGGRRRRSACSRGSSPS